MKYLPLFLLLTILTHAATPKFVDATAADNFKLHWLVKAKVPPVIDGSLNDAVWAEMKPLTDWGTTNYGRTRAGMGSDFIPGDVDFRVSWDDTYLYVGVRFHHRLNPNDMVEFKRNISDLSAAIYARECLELHIDGNLDFATRFQAIANPLQEKMMIWHYDFGWGILENTDYGLDADWDVAAAINDDNWTLEMRIALSDIQVEPNVGTMFSMNPCWFNWADSRAADGKRYWWQFVTWSTHDDSHHDPRLFGRFILVEKEPENLAAGLRLAFSDLDSRTVMIQTPDGYQVFDHGKVRQVGFDVQVRTEAKAARVLCDRTKDMLADHKTLRSGHYEKNLIPEQEAALTTIEAELAGAEPLSRGRISAMRRELGDIQSKLDQAYWVVKQDALLSNLVKPEEK